ncbi:MAG: cell division protein ZapC [Candidatus Anaerobiospirillum pullicola]|uniref:Cell division protein ZapC n=1 Tax=Candidatus Anaerobiospirillum pullicola TaxID=2838451 RepID=A0A948WZ63_9GAMM|nr:cell division protein ZapC [Candidatus Anaerobiospirillum pullicola]
MRITPGDSWTWSYQEVGGDEYLGLHLTLDNGVRYFFRTNFKVQHLAVFPEYGQPFCVLDGQLLNDFMTGLNEIGVYDNGTDQGVSTNMELALNAVACYRFVRAPKRAIEHAFMPYAGPEQVIKRGMVTSLYTKDHKVCDFIVLDGEDESQDGIFRLMFANREFRIGNRELSVGAMIKVPRAVIYPFRYLSRPASDINYA